MSGIPDVEVLLHVPRGRALFVEFKIKNRKLTPLQEATIEDLATRGGAAVGVAHTVDEGMDLIRRAERGEI